MRSGDRGFGLSLGAGPRTSTSTWSATGDDPARASAMRLERYRVLSGAFLALRDQEVEVARRRLAEAAGQTTGDPLAEGFRLLLEGRLALGEGDCESADRLARRSFDAAPVSNDAALMAATARIVCGRAAEVEELLEPRIGMTMGGQADFQEVRGHLAWLLGEDQRAWNLWDRRGDLPPGLGAQHRSRLLLGQDRAEAALAELGPAADILSRERLELLTAMAELRLGRLGQVERALAAELDRHPWLRDEADLVAAVLECRRGDGSRARLVQALAPVRQKARWDLYTHLDLPLQLALAADAATDLGERNLAATLLAEAETIRPGLELVAKVRAGLGRR